MLKTKIPWGNGWDLPCRLSSLNVLSPAPLTIVMVRKSLAEVRVGWGKKVEDEVQRRYSSMAGWQEARRDGTKFSLSLFFFQVYQSWVLKTPGHVGGDKS